MDCLFETIISIIIILKISNVLGETKKGGEALKPSQPTFHEKMCV